MRTFFKSELSFIFFIALQICLVLSSDAQNVGIGVSEPTSKLHTKGTLRFESLENGDSLKQFLVSDRKGNIFWKNQDSILANNAWLLNGNMVNDKMFIGSVNNQRLIIKVNNSEKMALLPNGNVGIGIANPNRILMVYNTLTDFNSELVVKQGPQSLLGAYLVLDNTANNGGKYWSIGSTGILNTAGQLGVAGSLEFYQFDAEPNERARMIITPQGFVGIHTVPKARLHVDGSVRFDNLPSGTGTALVINENGEIMRSSTVLNSLQSDSVTSKMDELSLEIANLKKVISQLESQIKMLPQK